MDNSDLDIYVSNLTDGGVCYFGALQAGGLTLNHDAHPICRPTPTQPEVITGVFAGSKTFSVWYNQYLNCTAPQAPTTQAFTVKNLGLITIQVFVGGSPFPITLTSGQSAVVLSSFAYAGYNTNTQVNFKGGTQVSIVCLGSSSLSLPSLPSSSFPSASLPSASSTSPTGIATVCCPSDLVASLLFATISNKAGTCTCLPNGATLSNVSLSPPTWHNLTIGTTCPGGNLDLTLQCQPSGIWLLSSTKCGISKTPTTVSCNPFSLSFIGLTCPGLCNSTFDITVTP